MMSVLHNILRFFQPCGFGWGGRKSWRALSKTWNLNNSPRRALWDQCDPDFVCSPSTVAEKQFLEPVHRPVSFEDTPEHHRPYELDPDRLGHTQYGPIRFTE